MPFRFGDIWRRYSPIGNWRLPGEPAFAKSRAFELLSRDLKRYVLEEVAGRSFLIAGHRGAGKTSTVVHAVRQLRRELITGSVDPASIPTGRRGRLQRPMMVKLVGEAILAAPPRQTEIEQAAEARAREDKAKKEAADRASAGEGGADEEAQTGEPPAESGGGESSDPVGNALVHITTALYRALAVEVSEAFTVHCLDGEERDRADRLELAAQLGLELDGTPEPAMLRGYWDRIGRLQRGILWPRESDLAIEQSGIRDQGLREVVAITTAAQAFQVCSGAVTYKIGQEKSDKTESRTESGLDVKELVNRLGALGAGALAGSVVGVGSGAAEGVGIGLLVWLASSLTLKWSGSRERKASRTLDYQFIQDRSIQTLDRDLPVVVDRIRHAGLAPVFVIDELDKLEKPDEQIAKIINRLKHLVADFGFFCFLANRSYFDAIQRKVADQAYPTEHTYFSERVLVLSRAEDLFDYLTGMLAEVPEEGPGALRAAVFALVVMFRSKLNFSDVAREVATLTGPNDELICTDEELQSPGPYRLAATIQIAIDRVLAAEDVRERMELDSGFAQLTIDALYYIGRAWESDTEACVDIRPRALRDDLLRRMDAKKAPVPDPLPPGDFPGPGEECAITPSDLRAIARMVDRLALYLSNFRTLQEELLSEASRAANQTEGTRLKRLADIVLTERTAMLMPAEPGETGRYCFVLNELARPISPPPPAPGPAPTPSPPPAPPPPARSRRARKAPVAPPPPPPDSPAVSPSDDSRLPPPPREVDPRLLEPIPLFDAIDTLLTTFKLSIDDLVAAEVLPAIVSQSQLEGSYSDIAAAYTAEPHNETVERVLNTYLAFVRALDDRGPEVAQALILTTEAVKVSGSTDARGNVLGRISRYFEKSGTWIVPSGMRSMANWVTFTSDPQSILAFVKAYSEQPPPPPGMFPWKLKQLREPVFWNNWRGVTERFLLQGPSNMRPILTMNDAATAAANLPPGNLFRLNLERMDAVDWSRVALTGVPTGGVERWPLWPLFAGLTALRFDSGLLRRIQESSLAQFRKDAVFPPPDELELINRLISRNGPAEGAVLHVLPDQPSRRILPVSESQPVLAIGASEFPSYVSALNWLAELDAFHGATRELA